MKLIVGLGNPGLAYKKTRHNIGFELIDALAAAHQIPLTNRRDKAITGCGVIKETPVLLIKPQTFMNLSGDSVAAIALKEEIEPKDILVVCDDIHLDVGRLRLRAKGSAGGQNGLKSVIARLETEEFPRLRLGVGEPPASGDVQRDWVLSRFNTIDRAIIDELLIVALGCVETWLTEGVELAATRFNGTSVRVQ